MAIPEDRIEVERVQNEEIEGGLSNQMGAQISFAQTESFAETGTGAGASGGADQLETANSNDKLEGGV